MNTIPKEEVDRVNALRYALLVKKNNVVDKVRLVRQTQKDFLGTDKQIQALKDVDSLKTLIADVVTAKAEAEVAAKNIDASGIWFDDIADMVARKDEEEEKKRRAEENAE